MSIHSKKFSANYMTFIKFAQFLWEAANPTIVLPDKKSYSRFFRTTAIPSTPVNSLTLDLLEDGSSLATHSVAFFRDCPFFSRVCSSAFFRYLIVWKGTVLCLQHPSRDQEKQWIILHQWNQSKCTHTGGERGRPSFEGIKTENNWLTTWWSATCNRQLVLRRIW